MLDSYFFIPGDKPKFLNKIGELNADYFVIDLEEPVSLKTGIDFFESLNISDVRLATFVHPMTYIAPNVELSPGCVILPNVSISASTKLGKCCRIMMGAKIEHNSNIGAHSFFATGCCAGSYLEIGEGVTISLNASVREFVKIGNYSTVGMGAVVLKDIGEDEIWVGNPAKKLR